MVNFWESLITHSHPTSPFFVQFREHNTTDSGMIQRPFIPPLRLFALIIGINEYKSPIKKLSGAVADADAMQDYLQKHLGVPSSQIRNLRNGQATRSAIINEIKAFWFNNDIQQGDPILIYYAGHGGWAETPKGWQAGGTGKIELLIPYDYSSHLEDGNHRHALPDRTLGALLSRLASKKGDNITVILDCCHSGSGTRDVQVHDRVRGIDVRNVPWDLDRDIWSDIGSSTHSTRGSVVHSQTGFAYNGLRSHVLLAACGAGEFAIERNGKGVFTEALLKALVNNGIDKLTYTSLIRRMPALSSRQNPQCEGVNRERFIFNKQAQGKRHYFHKIHHADRETYIMEAGAIHGITIGAEFNVYKDQDDSSHLLGAVIAVGKPDRFSVILSPKGSKFSLETHCFALQTCAGTEEYVRIHVAPDEALMDLARQIERAEAIHRIVQLVERDQAEIGIARVGNGNIVFNIFNSEVTKHGLTRMPFILEPTLQVVSPIIRAAAHFHFHLRRTKTDAEVNLANHVEIEMAELRLAQDNAYDNEDQVWYPSNWQRGKIFDLPIEDSGTVYGWRITNHSNKPLYPALFYFDNSDLSITSYYEPPIACGIVDPPLKGKSFLTLGYGDSGSDRHRFYLREGQNLDVGFLKLFLSMKPVDLSHITQSSPFTSAATRGGNRSRATAPLTTQQNKWLFWDTIVVPVVQRRVNKSSRGFYY